MFVFRVITSGDMHTKVSSMNPRKAFKAAVESSGQGSDVVSDTSPRSINTIKTWTYISDILQSELVNCSDDSNDNEKDDLATR
jgi:hypothetical protein